MSLYRAPSALVADEEHWPGTALSVLGQGIIFLGRALLMNPVEQTMVYASGLE